MSNETQDFNERERVRQVPTNVILPVIFREKLRFLARVTRVPQAVFIREALQDLLEKYNDVLERQPDPEREA